MKRYYDYEDHEILQMSEEDIEKLVEIECAVAGAPLRMAAPTPLAECSVEPDVTTYVVQASTLRFANREAALAAVEYLNGLPRLTRESIVRHTYGPPYRVEPDESELTVGTERNWSDAHYAAHKSELVARAAAKEEYDRARREFDAAQKSRQSSVDAVYSHFHAVRDRESNRRHCRETFASYLELAEGNQDIALGFMLRTAERYDEAFIRETLNFPKTKPETQEAVANGAEQEEGRGAADGAGQDDSPEL